MDLFARRLVGCSAPSGVVVDVAIVVIVVVVDVSVSGIAKAAVKLGGHFGPEKKILSPPPPTKFLADTLPALPTPSPPPSKETTPPLLGFSIKT